jgi:methionyl-tRNA synthetase
MIIHDCDPATMRRSYGIDMSDIDAGQIDGLGVSAAWGRVAPCAASEPHQHDETETFVIVRGEGVLVVDGVEHAARAGTVVQFEPFESHVIRNTGTVDLVFATFYWRDAQRAHERATGPAVRRRFGDRPTFVFSTPPTPNGDLHLGHLSGPYLGADVYVRFQRLNGADAWHLTGSDDFQSYVVECARREGRSPSETAAHYSHEIAETLRLLDVEIDQYTVTNQDPSYQAGLRDFFSRIVDSAAVTPRPGPALFDAETGDYLYEVDVLGTCPTCGTGTGGNICEECGEPNVCSDLVDARARRSGLPPLPGTAVRYMLSLHEFRDDVVSHHRLGRVPGRLRELAHRLFERATVDIPVSHPSSWGVAPQETDVDGQVIWVWPEMSYGFLHGIQALGERSGKPWRASDPDPRWKIVHFFGYDNSFYHSVLYPVLYKLAYPDWTPDIDYNVNEFLLLDGSKFSTSRRHAIWGKEVLSPDTVDAVRYYLASIRAETARSNFDRSAFDAVVRDVLVGHWQQWLDDLGQRVERDHGGTAPDAGTWTPEHTAFLARLAGRLQAVSAALAPDGFSLNLAAAELHGIVGDARRFRDLESRSAGLPEWAAEARTAIALELTAARLLAVCAAPLMPRFSARLGAALGTGPATDWPALPELVAPGTAIRLAGQRFFDDDPGNDDGSAAADGLVMLVRSTLRLPEDEPVAERRLLDLGASSLQALALQYQVYEQFGCELSIDELLGERTVADLAAQVG